MPPSPKKPSAAPKSKVAKPSQAPIDLPALRQQIDALDGRLVEILNQRAELVVEVGRYKRANNVPIYAPHREAEVLDNALKASRGPLPPRALEGIFRELMSGSFALELPLRVGYLGPPGSFSHAAAVRHFGSSIEFHDLHTIEGVFTEVRRGHVDHGLAPVENSIGGGIVETLGALQSLADGAGDVGICAEVQIEVHHALLANAAPGAIRRIHSKPEIFDQCRKWLSTQYPQAELLPAASSSRAAQLAAEECQVAAKIGATPGSAAIGSELAGQIYGLNLLFPRIEDNPANVTRFVVLGKQRPKPTGDDKTTIMFSTADKPGALARVLTVFERAKVNLSHIDKRPSGKVNWTYTFFIDALGHRDDANVQRALRGAKGHCRELVVLGSYPRSRRVL